MGSEGRAREAWAPGQGEGLSRDQTCHHFDLGTVREALLLCKALGLWSVVVAAQGDPCSWNPLPPTMMKHGC